MNADAKETLPWNDEVPVSPPPRLGDDEVTELVPVASAPVLAVGETSELPAPHPEAAKAEDVPVSHELELPSVMVSPELTVVEPRAARALEALTGETPTLPSVLQRVGGAVATPFGFAGAAGQRLWMTLSSPGFRADIERLTQSPGQEAESAPPAPGAQLGRVLRRAAALLLPTMGLTAMLAIVSFPRLGIEDAFAGSSTSYELTPLVDATGAPYAPVEEGTPESLRGEWPSALQVRLPGAHDDGASRK